MSTDVWVVGLQEASGFGSRFGWYFYCSRCYCSCTNHKYERDKTLRDRLDGDKFKGSNGSSQLKQFDYFQSCFENVHTGRSRDTV